MIFNRSFLYGPLRQEKEPGDAGGGDSAKPPSDNKKGPKAAKAAIEGTKDAFRDLGTLTAEFTNRLNQAKDPMFKILESTLRIRDANEELVKSGGDFYSKFAPGGDFSKSLSNVIKLSQDFFGNAEAGAKAMTGLATGMRSFVAVSSEVQQNLGETITYMSQLGFETNDLAKALDNQAMAFGTNQRDLQGYATAMSKISNTLFVEPKKLMQDFNMVQENFAYSSDRTMDVFTSLQEQSRKTGVEFSTMADKFGGTMDTFSGVSGIAGKLNAILGDAVFNPLQLLNMDEAQRAAAIREGIQSSPILAGRDINDLKKFELKSIASTLGMSVLETRKYLTQQGDVRQELESTIDKRMEAAGGKEGLSNLPATNVELRRMQDTLRNLRLAQENLAIDASRIMSRTTNKAFEGLGAEMGIGGDTSGRAGDLMRLLTAVAGGEITVDEIRGQQIDDLMKMVEERYNRARSDEEINRGAPGANPGMLASAKLNQNTALGLVLTALQLGLPIADKVLNAAGIPIPAGGIEQLKPLGGSLFGPALTAGEGSLEKIIANFQANASEKQIDSILNAAAGTVANGVLDGMSSENFRSMVAGEVRKKMPVVPGQ